MRKVAKDPLKVESARSSSTESLSQHATKMKGVPDEMRIQALDILANVGVFKKQIGLVYP